MILTLFDCWRISQVYKAIVNIRVNVGNNMKKHFLVETLQKLQKHVYSNLKNKIVDITSYSNFV